MKKLKLFLVAALLISGSYVAYKSVTTNSCMRDEPYYDLLQPVSKTDGALPEGTSEKKRFKQTEEAMKAFGKYVPLPKSENYFAKCSFGEVTYAADGEPVQFAYYVRNRDLKTDVQKGVGSEWEYDQQFVTGEYSYHVSKEPFANSFADSGLEGVTTILLDDVLEALHWKNEIQWKDDQFYYRFYHWPDGHDKSIMAFYANSTRVNLSSMPDWVHGIR